MTTTPGATGTRPGTFRKGDDPRRNKGNKCAEAKSFGIRFSDALSKGGDPKALADLLWEKALKGQPWAIDIVLDRLIGKPKDNEGEAREFKIVYAGEPEK